jgi:flavin reductase (DIM6/NTAB) family NADH-FMN oxidoreductase RutF
MVTTNDEELAQVMEEMPYGLYIIGSHAGDGDPNGMMADWVMQVSFQPRLIAVAFENDAHTLQNIRDTQTFTINLLGQNHEGMAIAKHFGQPYLDAKVKGRSRYMTPSVHRKLDGVSYFRSPNGSPVLDDAIAWVECEAQEFYPAGDHTLVVAQVTNGRIVRETEPLTSEYTGWPYSG